MKFRDELTLLEIKNWTQFLPLDNFKSDTFLFLKSVTNLKSLDNTEKYNKFVKILHNKV